MLYKCEEFAFLFWKWKRAVKTKDKWKEKITRHTISCPLCQSRINHKLSLAELRTGKTKKNK